MSRKRQYRRCKEAEDEDDDGSDSDQNEGKPVKLKSMLDDIKDVQKMRHKSSGLSATELALGKDVGRMERGDTVDEDPFKLRSGGVIDIKNLTRSQLDNADVEENIKRQFSKESHLRDEDAEMRKYVDEKLADTKKTLKNEMTPSSGSTASESCSATVRTAESCEDALLQRAADKLKKYQSKASEEMLSNQMLSGIPEVDLGIEARIKNIEETEAKKQKMLKEAIEKQRHVEKTTSYNQDIVKDLSKDYVQHQIYYIEKSTEIGQEDWRVRNRPRTEIVPVVSDDTPRYEQRPVEPVAQKTSPSRMKKKYYEKKVAINKMHFQP